MASGNYLAQDRSGIEVAVMELRRGMSETRDRDWSSLKRPARYLMDETRVIVKFGYRGEISQLIVWTAADSAECARTRKCTSGGVIQCGSRLVKSWSSTQGLVALSSGEAEYHGIVKGASMGLGIKSMVMDVWCTGQCDHSL